MPSDLFSHFFHNIQFKIFSVFTVEMLHYLRHLNNFHVISQLKIHVKLVFIPFELNLIANFKKEWY